MTDLTVVDADAAQICSTMFADRNVGPRIAAILGELNSPAPSREVVMGTPRVSTGHSTHGKAIMASDQTVEPVRVALLPGFEFVNVWGADVARSSPTMANIPARLPTFALAATRHGRRSRWTRVSLPVCWLSSRERDPF